MAKAEKPVAVITGAGGMGCAIARRIGGGSTLVLADADEARAQREAATLADSGFDVVAQQFDVAERESVVALATSAAEIGRVTIVAHTAGVSPVQTSAAAIMRVDLVGTALMLDAFGEVIDPGGAGVFIASMAGTMASLDREIERKLATTPTDALLGLPEIAAIDDPDFAYPVAKRANHLRVQAAASAWGRQGARVNTISPGVIATPMGAAELAGPHGEFMRTMIAESATHRIGSVDDIAAAAAFLLSRDASFITGTDLLVDGGVVAWINNQA